MRYLLIFFLLFFSSSVFSADVWRQDFYRVLSRSSELISLCESSASSSSRAWKTTSDSVAIYCYSNANPCDLPQIWDQTTFSCRTPCPSNQTASRQFSPAVNVVCVGGCSVIQSGDSNCTGTASEGGICTALFTTTGAFCPNSGADNSTAPDTGGGDTGGGDTGGGDTGGGDTGGGDTGGGDTGGGDTGGGDTGGGDTGGGGTGSGSGSWSGGLTCESPPVCSAGPDSISCAQLFQEWRQRCPSSDLITNPGNGDGVYDANDHDLNIADRLQQQKDRYTDKVNEIKDALQSQLSLSVSGGGSLTCNPQQIFGQTIDLSICARMDFLNLISGLFMAVAVVLSAYIILAPRG
jgi:hypothetical protein